MAKRSYIGNKTRWYFEEILQVEKEHPKGDSTARQI
tara:strand:+ start:31853 stop:31960 length:108 start_codon:yes stop_codon:yes gene_type:complete